MEFEDAFPESEQRPYVEPKMDFVNRAIIVASAILFVATIIYIVIVK